MGLAATLSGQDAHATSLHLREMPRILVVVMIFIQNSCPASPFLSRTAKFLSVLVLRYHLNIVSAILHIHPSHS